MSTTEQSVDDNADGSQRQALRYRAMNGYIHSKECTGERATLARINPALPLSPRQIAALARALLMIGLEPANWRPETWRKWALIVSGVALAGHDEQESLGKQLAEAGVSESRVTKLLTARGDAFKQLIPRMIRLMANKGVSPNWNDLGAIIRKGDSDSPADIEYAEKIRLRIASDYFSELTKKHTSRFAS